MRQIVVVVVEHVGEHQRGAFQPRHAPQRRQVGLHDEIAIALVPARRRVAGHRLHVDVVGEQIVAAVRLLMRAVDEILRLEALADQPALHVDHRHHDRVDGAALAAFFNSSNERLPAIGNAPIPQFDASIDNNDGAVHLGRTLDAQWRNAVLTAWQMDYYCSRFRASQNAFGAV